MIVYSKHVSMFFVYVDSTNDGRPFYVGKGDARRVSQPKRNRKHTWVSHVLGRKREIVIQTSIEQLTLEQEIAIIAELDTFTTNYAHHLDDIRCNFTRGGEGLTGHKDTIETRQKKRANAERMGKDPAIQLRKSLAMRCRSFTSETLEKMKRRRAVIQLDMNDVIIAQFKTVKEAQEATGIWNSNICMACRGKHKSAGGYRWRYENMT